MVHLCRYPGRRQARSTGQLHSLASLPSTLQTLSHTQGCGVEIYIAVLVPANTVNFFQQLGGDLAETQGCSIPLLGLGAGTVFQGEGVPSE